MAYCAHCGTQVPEVSWQPCPSCGKPTNGAPAGAVPPQPRSGGSNVGKIILWVVIGGFGLVFVIGILAAIAIPNLLTAQHRSKQARTMADLRTIATAVETYGTDKNMFPDVKSIGELEPLLAPTYIQSVPKLDGWTRELRYECWQTEKPCDAYAVASAGKDGQFERSSLREYTPAPTTDFDRDIVFSNGNFVQHPATARTQ